MATQPALRLPEKIPTVFARPLLKSLVALACKEASAELGPFLARLTEALRQLCDQPASRETEAARNALQHLAKNTVTFARLVASCLDELLSDEIDAIGNDGASQLERGAM